MLTLYIKAKYLLKVHTMTVNNKAWHYALNGLCFVSVPCRPLTYIKRWQWAGKRLL